MSQYTYLPQRDEILDYDRKWLDDIWKYSQIANHYMSESREREQAIEDTKRKVLALLDGQRA